MIRMFETHEKRKQKELGGIWKLETLSDSGNVTGKYTATVPSCWESVIGLEDYRGRAKYSATVKTSSENLRFIFKGISHTGDIYLDGKHIGHHYNAYTPFTVPVSDCEEGEHLLEVIADNRFTPDSALHVPNDYRTYGGINRPVALEELCNAYIEYLHVKNTRTENSWSTEFVAKICRFEDNGKTYTATVELAGKTLDFGKIAFEGNTAVITAETSFTDVDEWFPETPNLYIAHAKLFENGEYIDDLKERIGFRDVKIDGEKILVNGKQVFLKGFNRHEDYGILGSAVPENIMSYDLDIIASTGSNFVRTCHYPNDERFLDMCDEKGFFVWEEGHARGLNEDRMKNPNFKKQSADCIEEMVTNHFNHPSIIIWGILNECASHTEYGAECYKLQYDQLKALDPSRPRTSATCQHLKDLCYDMEDIVSLNIYPTWYVNSDVTEYYTKIKNYIDSCISSPKPLIISEFGAASIYGYRAFSHVKWSEDRQCDILKNIIETLSSHEEISGLAIWQFADCRIDDDYRDWNSRPKTQNNKGIVDIFRNPKQSYYTVRECFTKIENYKN
ncbi:MAG: beta-glucuronidase [Ruminococcaceae bacterium]|nr:beta-glucuronidase [Oscillospiraceae bacterium]